MSNIVFITGATAGIGEACAHKFAANKYKLIISGRREKRLEKLASELSNTYGANVLPLVLDVRDKEQVKNAIRNLPEE